MINAWIKKVGRNPELVNIEPKLEVLQELVDGYIEQARGRAGLLWLFDEDGLRRGLQPNIIAIQHSASPLSLLPLAGTVVCVAGPGDTWTSVNSVTLEQVAGHWLRLEAS